MASQVSMAKAALQELSICEQNFIQPREVNYDNLFGSLKLIISTKLDIMKQIKPQIIVITNYIQKYKSNNQGDSNTRHLGGVASKTVNRLKENVERYVAPAMVKHFPRLSTPQQKIITIQINALILYINQQKNSIERIIYL
jgi:hypothetical protein